jgi:hypothetical protein
MQTPLNGESASFEPIESHSFLHQLSSKIANLDACLETVCDVKQFGSFRVFRYNRDKTLLWLTRLWEASDKSEDVWAMLESVVTGHMLDKLREAVSGSMVRAKTKENGVSSGPKKVVVVGDAADDEGDITMDDGVRGKKSDDKAKPAKRGKKEEPKPASGNTMLSYFKKK